MENDIPKRKKVEKKTVLEMPGSTNAPGARGRAKTCGK
jgi:hypothetical protein